MGGAKMEQISLVVGFLKKLAHDLLCLIYFNNIKELREQKERLILATVQLRKDFGDAKARKRGIKQDAETWLGDAMTTLEAVRTLEDNIQANKRGLTSRLNWRQRCRLRDEIENLKRKLLHHVRHSHFDRAVLATLWENVFSSDFMASQSLKSALSGVVNEMKDECDPSVIAVCGPRGVGKTTLAELVEKKAEELLKFKVVRLVVSQSTNTEEVQEKLAAFLNLNLQNTSTEEKAERLRHRLRLKNKQKILIILDNVCKELNLVSIGIPSHVSCKILVTTSDEQVCSSLKQKTTKVIQLGALDKTDAWKLLEKNLSPNASSEIKQVAKQIAEEFKHSPISVITLGRALKGKVLAEWLNAYQSLKSELVEGEKENVKIVYRSVKLSYDYLKDHETKKCFLLCSLFPEDYPIALQTLKRYAWGLGIYQGIDSIEIVGEKVAEAIKSLEKSFLLSEQGKKHVRIPNVIREAALLIASKDGNFLRIKSLVGLRERPNNEDLESYTAISYVASQQEELVEEFQSENLQILFLGGDSYKTIPNDFSQRLTALKVLAIHHGLLSSNALQNLINLKALHLEHCKLDGGLSSLVELNQLEILSLKGSDICELPDEIGDLNNLRLLDLSGCQKLQRIPLNLIRSLSRLEELYFSGLSFEQWWSKEKIAEGSNTTLWMINSFSSLATESFEYQGSNNECDATSRALKVSAFFQNESNESKLTVTLLDRDRILFVQNHVVPNLVQSVKKVRVQRCDNLQEVFQNGRILHAGEDDLGALVSDLTSLELEESQLSSLTSICYGQTPHVGLQNLNTLKLKDCLNLQSLFSMTFAQSLKQLETLEIHGCNELKQIIVETRSDDVDETIRPVDESIHPPRPPHPPYLPRLTTLVITGCGALEYIFQITTPEVLPTLTRLEITNCLQLKEVFSFRDAADEMDIEVPQLQTLKLDGLMSLRTFCPDNLSIKLPSLQHLEVGACHELSKNAMFKLIGHRQLKELCLFKVGNQLCEKIFEYEGGCLLSCLEKLKLKDLNELQHVIWKEPTQIVTLQKLTRLEVVKCNKLRNVFSLLLARNLLQLSHLVVQECDELVQLIARDQISSSSSSSRFKPVYFPNLEEILIQDCKKLKSLFPVSVARLPKLKTFSVRRASELVEIFRHEGEARGKSKKETKGGAAKVKSEKEIVKLRFPNLETLHLEKLTTLLTFNPVDYCCEFPHLKSLQVKDCYSLATRFETSESDPTVYAKTNETLLKRKKHHGKLKRSATVVEIPIRNGDIDWSPGMKID